MMHSIRRDQLTLPISSSISEIAAKEANIRGNEEKIIAVLKAYKDVIESPEEEAALTKLSSTFSAVSLVNQKFLRFMKASETRDVAEYEKISTEIQNAMKDTEAAVGELITFNEKGAEEAEIANTTLYKNSLKLTYILSGCTLLAGLILAVFMTRHIKRPLMSSVTDLAAIGSGDLSVRIKNDRNDEIGQIQASLVKKCCRHFTWW
jgi:methyl-accepting chemotaxis protein